MAVAVVGLLICVSYAFGRESKAYVCSTYGVLCFCVHARASEAVVRIGVVGLSRFVTHTHTHHMCMYVHTIAALQLPFSVLHSLTACNI